MTSEEAYEILANIVQKTIGLPSWDKLELIAEILNSSFSYQYWRYDNQTRDQGLQRDLSFPVENKLNDALFFLRDNILETTGERIWGLKFELYANGKFNLTYDYDMPESYKQALKEVDV